MTKDNQGEALSLEERVELKVELEVAATVGMPEVRVIAKIGLSLLAALEEAETENGVLRDDNAKAWRTANDERTRAEKAEQQAAEVPAGYRLVPIEPTETMLLHGCKAGLSMATLLDDTRFACERAVWSAMLQASLSPSDSEADNG